MAYERRDADQDLPQGTDRVFVDLPVAAPQGGLIDTLTLKAHTPSYCPDRGRECVNGVILAMDVGMVATTLMASRCRTCGTVIAWFNESGGS